ncbi:HNH endonuclease [Nonomuraea recticatena]|uniref:HNH endonuclease n=1 Tax=Nonomuraea recticatena TaxID=46178 RepID=UPI00360C43AE
MPRARSICSGEPNVRCLRVAVRRGKCSEHAPAPWAGSARNEERPTNWNTIRNLVRSRDKYTCRSCGKQGAFIVDHIIPVARGGDWSMENLQVLCTECHDPKSARERQTKRASP